MGTGHTNVPIGTLHIPQPDLFLAAIDRLYRDSDLGVLIEDAAGKVIYANQELHTLLRIPLDTGSVGLGMATDDYLQPALKWFTQPQNVADTMASARHGAISRVGDDIELVDHRYLERHYSPIFQDGRTQGYLWIYREITRRETDRREALEGRRQLAETNRTLFAANTNLNRANHLLEAVVHIQDLLISTGDETIVFNEILNVSLALTDSEFGFLAETQYNAEGDREVLVNRAISDIAWDQATAEVHAQRNITPMIFDSEESLFGYVQHTGQPLITTTPVAHPRASGLPTGHPPLSSFAGLPILVQDRVIGVLGLANSTHGFSQDLNEWMQPFLATCAAVLVNVRAMRERRVVMERLRVMSIRAEQASTAKNTFLSRMSHEVRTPLNGILGFAQLMAMRTETEVDRNDAQRIVLAGKHLLALFDDVIDLSAIEAGRITVRPQVIDLPTVMAGCAELARELQVERGSSLTFHLPDTAGLIYLDPLRLRQILLNLIANSLKYSHVGSHVNVTVTRGDGNRLIINVSDDGPGIPQEKWRDVFEPFWRHETTAASVSGRGLGLPVSRSIAEAMEGTLDLIESQPSRTVFQLNLPAVLASIEEDPSAQHRSATDAPLLGRVLYVEDMADNSDIVRATIALLHPHVDVVVARTGQQARQMWTEEQPDLVLLDLHLPDVDGFTLEKELRELNIPAVLLTADATAETQHRTEELPATRLLLKPISADVLDHVLHQHLVKG